MTNTDNRLVPRGMVKFTVKRVYTKRKGLNRKGKVRFNIRRNLRPGTYKVIAQFKGKCRFRNSRDVAFLTVQRRR